jgi:peptide/nickel transport system permease protein
MLRFLTQRTAVLIPTFIGITLVTFLVVNLSPGGPQVVQDLNVRVSSETRERLVRLYGLDRPVHQRYLSWLRRAVLLDFGTSFKDGKPVMAKIAERLPATLLLNILSLGLVFVVGCLAGIIAAAYRNRWPDRLIDAGVFLGYAVPKYWLALLLMILFGIKLGWLPISGLRSINWEYLSPWRQVTDIAAHLVLPVVILSIGGFAGLARYVRGRMGEELDSDYVRGALAQGASENAVLFGHAFRNTLIPVVTILGLSLPELIGGAFIIETIFSYPGMGRLGFDAIMARDYPLIMGIGTITALLTLAGNFIADVLYGYLDPRIRYR